MEERIGNVPFKDAKRKVYEIIGRPLATKPIHTTFTYRNADNKPVIKVNRIDNPDGAKKISQLGNSEHGWVSSISGVDLVPYNLPAVLKAETVYIVEGEKCADAINELGLCGTTNNGGSGNWKSSYNHYFQGKKVVILPDNDAPGAKHAERVREELFPVADEVRVVILPGLGLKGDVCDWIEQRGGTREELERLTDEAKPAGRVEVHREVKTERVLVEGEGPNALAVAIMKTNSFLFHKRYLYAYNGSYWVDIDEFEVMQMALNEEQEKETTAKRRHEVMDYIRTKCYRRSIPWNSIKFTEIPFHDGVYDIETGAVRPHRKEDYLQTVIPHRVPNGRNEDCSAWLGCLDTYFNGDPDKNEKILAIQEFFGYCLMAGHARYKKALLLTGDTDCGKSTIPMAIGWMVGDDKETIDNCCSVSIEDMDDKGDIAPIVGKLVNRISELKSNAAVADGGFKKLVSTGDSVSIEKKYKDIIEYKPVAKHVIVTNNLPTVNDRSKATFNRMLLIKFNHSIPKEDQTTDVYDAIKAQLPGLTSWALVGAKRLYEAQGKFTKIPESEHEINDYKKRENSLLEFIEDHCIPDPECSIPRDHFHTRLEAYGVKIQGPSKLSRELGKIGIEVANKYHRGMGSPKSVVGFRFRKSSDDELMFSLEDGALVQKQPVIN
jgi:putative DNA primase/helicase